MPRVSSGAAGRGQQAGGAIAAAPTGDTVWPGWEGEQKAGAVGWSSRWEVAEERAACTLALGCPPKKRDRNVIPRDE